MLYIPKVDDYLKVLIDEEVKNFVAYWTFAAYLNILPVKYFKTIREEKNLRKVAKSFYIFLTTRDEVDKYVQSNSSENCIHQYNVGILKMIDLE